MITKQEKIGVLSHVDIFSSLDKRFISKLEKEAKVLSLDEGDILFEKGQSGQAMYVVASGKLKVHDEDHVFSLLQRYQCVGEYSLIDLEVRSASVTTVEDSEVLELSQETFRKLFNSNQNFIFAILRNMIQRLRNNNISETKFLTRNIKLQKQKIEIEDNKKEILLAKQELQNINENKNKLFFTIADTLNKTFKNTALLTQELSEEFNNLNAKQQKEKINSINAFFQNTDICIQSILIWSKLHLGYMGVNFTRNNVVEVIEEVKKVYSNINSNKSVIFNVLLQEPIYGIFDKEMIRMAINYLSLSILDYLEDGAFIDISIKQQQDLLEIIFLYDIEIKETALKNILTADLPQEQTKSRKSSNFALGVMFAKELFHKNSGDIAVQYTKDNKTKIIFTLPKAL